MIVEALRRENAVVGWLWRLFAAGLVAAFLILLLNSERARTFVFRLDLSLIDAFQRASGADEPSGEIIVVGVDGDAINAIGRWPWPRAKVAELIETVAKAGARSIAIDFLLTEPGPFSNANIFRVFRENAPEVIALRGEDPEEQLVRALALAPTALAVAGGARENFDTESGQVFCADPALMSADDAKPYYVECLFYPLDVFYEVTDVAVTRAADDVDGVVRRGRALAVQPYVDDNGATREIYFPAFPVAALLTCAGDDPSCLGLAIAPEDLTNQAISEYGNFELALTRDEGPVPPPLPLTPSFTYWLDFGALNALDAPKPGDEPGPHSTVSALDVMLKDQAALARLGGKHVAIGLTRLGDVDLHATPLASVSGTPGVVIQALATDNILSGRALAQPAWGGYAGWIIAWLMAALALARFFTASLYGLTAIVAAVVALPALASWAAFEFWGVVLFSATPALSAAFAVFPIFFGRIFAVIRSWLADRDEKNRQSSRLDVLNRMQEGSLPFNVDLSHLGVETAAICRPSKEVGGDFFELMELPSGQIYGAVGDVMGKDVNASLVSVISKTISGAVTSRTSGPLGEAFEELSAEFLRLAPRHWIEEEGGFVVFAAARVDPETGWAEFAAAGTEPPVVVGADGEIRAVDLPAVAPFGWLDKPKFETATLQLSPGDSIVMFTDGVTEAPAPIEEQGTLEFGYERAQIAVREVAGQGAAAMLARLDQRITEHLAGGDPIDDTTILAITWRGGDAAV